ncbi:unnamed protein product, partial [Polarella glacialis]
AWIGCLFLAAAALLLAGFWAYHLWLVCTGRTTKEHLGRRQSALDVAGEPTLFAARGPKLFDPRAWVDDDNWPLTVAASRRRQVVAVPAALSSATGSLSNIGSHRSIEAPVSRTVPPLALPSQPPRQPPRMVPLLALPSQQPLLQGPTEAAIPPVGRSQGGRAQEFQLAQDIARDVQPTQGETSTGSENV